MLVPRDKIGRAAIRFVGRLLFLILAIELLLHCNLWWFGEQNVLQTDPTFGWRVKPQIGRAYRSSEGPYLLETNSKGHRDHEHPVNRSGDARRILLIGSSTVFGDGVDQHQMFSEILERSLPKTEVINFSIPSVAADQHFLMLREEGIKYQPDIVIQFLASTDAMDPFSPWSLLPLQPKSWLDFENGDIVIHPPNVGFASQVVQSSNLCQFGMFVFVILLAQSDVNVDELALSLVARPMRSRESSKRALKRLFAATRDLCRDNFAEYLVVYLPSVREQSGETDELGVFLRDEVLSGIEGCRLVSLVEPLRDAQLSGIELLDGFHLNSRGHEIVAEKLAHALAPNNPAEDESQ